MRCSLQSRVFSWPTRNSSLAECKPESPVSDLPPCVSSPGGREDGLRRGQPHGGHGALLCRAALRHDAPVVRLRHPGVFQSRPRVPAQRLSAVVRITLYPRHCLSFASGCSVEGSGTCLRLTVSFCRGGQGIHVLYFSQRKDTCVKILW